MKNKEKKGKKKWAAILLLLLAMIGSGAIGYKNGYVTATLDNEYIHIDAQLDLMNTFNELLEENKALKGALKVANTVIGEQEIEIAELVDRIGNLYNVIADKDKTIDELESRPPEVVEVVKVVEVEVMVPVPVETIVEIEVPVPAPYQDDVWDPWNDDIDESAGSHGGGNYFGDSNDGNSSENDDVNTDDPGDDPGDDDGNNGHGNDDDGVDDSNPGNSNPDNDDDDDDDDDDHGKGHDNNKGKGHSKKKGRGHWK